MNRYSAEFLEARNALRIKRWEAADALAAIDAALAALEHAASCDDIDRLCPPGSDEGEKLRAICALLPAN